VRPWKMSGSPSQRSPPLAIPFWSRCPGRVRPPGHWEEKPGWGSFSLSDLLTWSLCPIGQPIPESGEPKGTPKSDAE
jgi:hypothetical protein